MTATTTPTSGGVEGVQLTPVPVVGERRWASLLQGTGVVVLVVVIWEVLSRTEVLNPHFIPPPSVVLATWYDWIFGVEDGAAGHRYSGTWLEHVFASSQRVFIGFLVASVAGIVLGILIGWFRIVESLIDPLIQLLRPIPVTAWIPFAIVFFGLSPVGAIFLIALGAFFPIVLNTTAGAQRTPRILVRAALMLGTPKRELLWKVVLPAALPSIFTGVRLGLGVAWVLVIVAEMLAVRSGLGYVMWDAYQLIRMDLIVATMISVGLLGFLSDWIVLAIRKRSLRWSQGLFN